jgi:hypothetical protein
LEAKGKYFPVKAKKAEIISIMDIVTMPQNSDGSQLYAGRDFNH